MLPLPACRNASEGRKGRIGEEKPSLEVNKRHIRGFGQKQCNTCFVVVNVLRSLLNLVQRGVGVNIRGLNHITHVKHMYVLPQTEMIMTLSELAHDLQSTDEGKQKNIFDAFTKHANYTPANKQAVYDMQTYHAILYFEVCTSQISRIRCCCY